MCIRDRSRVALFAKPRTDVEAKNECCQPQIAHGGFKHCVKVLETSFKDLHNGSCNTLCGGSQNTVPA
eukprot:4678707-Prorocentrum_lima.AAC.1